MKDRVSAKHKDSSRQGKKGKTSRTTPYGQRHEGRDVAYAVQGRRTGPRGECSLSELVVSMG